MKIDILKKLVQDLVDANDAAKKPAAETPKARARVRTGLRAGDVYMSSPRGGNN